MGLLRAVMWLVTGSTHFIQQGTVHTRHKIGRVYIATSHNQYSKFKGVFRRRERYDGVLTFVISFNPGIPSEVFETMLSMLDNDTLSNVGLVVSGSDVEDGDIASALASDESTDIKLSCRAILRGPDDVCTLQEYIKSIQELAGADSMLAGGQLSDMEAMELEKLYHALSFSWVNLCQGLSNI